MFQEVSLLIPLYISGKKTVRKTKPSYYIFSTLLGTPNLAGQKFAKEKKIKMNERTCMITKNMVTKGTCCGICPQRQNSWNSFTSFTFSYYILSVCLAMLTWAAKAQHDLKDHKFIIPAKIV